MGGCAGGESRQVMLTDMEGGEELHRLTDFPISHISPHSIRSVGSTPHLSEWHMIEASQSSCVPNSPLIQKWESKGERWRGNQEDGG